MLYFLRLKGHHRVGIDKCQYTRMMRADITFKLITKKLANHGQLFFFGLF